MTNEFEMLITGHQFKRICEKEYGTVMNTYGIRKVELDILYFLSHCGGHDTARDIARVNSISKAHVSAAVEHLVHKELIGTREDPEDRRRVHLSLTETGAAAVEEIIKSRKKVTEIVYRGVTEEERRVIQQVAAKIAKNLQEEMIK